MCPNVKILECLFNCETRGYCCIQLSRGSGKIIHQWDIQRTWNSPSASSYFFLMSAILLGSFMNFQNHINILSSWRAFTSHSICSRTLCSGSHVNSTVTSCEAIYSQAQLLHVLHEITSGLVDIGKVSNDAREGILDVSGKVSPFFLIRLELLWIQ